MDGGEWSSFFDEGLVKEAMPTNTEIVVASCLRIVYPPSMLNHDEEVSWTDREPRGEPEGRPYSVKRMEMGTLPSHHLRSA